MEKSPELDNQQATSRIAGLYLGEGHFILAKNPRANGKWNIDTEVGFSNKDAALVDLVCSFLIEKEIPHHIGTNSEGCYQVKVDKQEHIKKLLDILLPYLYGRKLAEARLLYRYVIRAIEKRNRPVGSIPGSGKFVGFERRRKNLQFDETDFALVSEKESLKESSETKRIPQCYEKHRHKPRYPKEFSELKCCDAVEFEMI